MGCGVYLLDGGIVNSGTPSTTLHSNSPILFSVNNLNRMALSAKDEGYIVYPGWCINVFTDVNYTNQSSTSTFKYFNSTTNPVLVATSNSNAGNSILISFSSDLTAFNSVALEAYTYSGINSPLPPLTYP